MIYINIENKLNLLQNNASTTFKKIIIELFTLNYMNKFNFINIVLSIVDKGILLLTNIMNR